MRYFYTDLSSTILKECPDLKSWANDELSGTNWTAFILIREAGHIIFVTEHWYAPNSQFKLTIEDSLGLSDEVAISIFPAASKLAEKEHES